MRFSAAVPAKVGVFRVTKLLAIVRAWVPAPSKVLADEAYTVPVPKAVSEPRMKVSPSALTPPAKVLLPLSVVVAPL